MQQSQPHINLYWAVILFSWGGKILHEFESRMMTLLSAYIVYLRPPYSVGITMLLCSYLTDT